MTLTGCGTRAGQSGGPGLFMSTLLFLGQTPLSACSLHPAPPPVLQTSSFLWLFLGAGCSRWAYFLVFSRFCQCLNGIILLQFLVFLSVCTSSDCCTMTLGLVPWLTSLFGSNTRQRLLAVFWRAVLFSAKHHGLGCSSISLPAVGERPGPRTCPVAVPGAGSSCSSFKQEDPGVSP